MPNICFDLVAFPPALLARIAEAPARAVAPVSFAKEEIRGSSWRDDPTGGTHFGANTDKITDKLMSPLLAGNKIFKKKKIQFHESLVEPVDTEAVSQCGLLEFILGSMHVPPSLPL